MKKIKVLNLYAGIGGNRKLWPNELIEVTAIENNKDIAFKYNDLYPQDITVREDAKEFLIHNYQDFDFIWASPPCQTHSQTNYFLNAQGIKRFPDMSLWHLIIFMDSFVKCKWVIENVKPYYPPPFKPYVVGRHYFWSNFYITKIKMPKIEIGRLHGTVQQRKQNRKNNYEERNMVNPKLGLHVFNCAFKEKQQVLINGD